MKMKMQRKRVKFQLVDKAASDNGEVSILGASFLNIDRGQELIVPGAFLPHLEQFSRNGKVLIDHEASVRKIAAKVYQSFETRPGLVINSRFTGDETGQWARDRAKEGAIDTTSIGMFVHASSMATEEQVRKLWMEHTYEPSPYDLKMLARGPVRLITEAEPVEVSFVVIPMNPQARVLEVKGILWNLETKKGAMLNSVNRGAVLSIYQLAKSILRSAKLIEEEGASQEASNQGGPPEEKSAIVTAEKQSRTDLLRLKLKLLDLETKIKRS